MPVFVCMSLVTDPVEGLRDASVPHIFYPFGHDKGDRTVRVGDDASSRVNIATGFPFLDSNYNTLFVRIIFIKQLQSIY